MTTPKNRSSIYTKALLCGPVLLAFLVPVSGSGVGCTTLAPPWWPALLVEQHSGLMLNVSAPQQGLAPTKQTAKHTMFGHSVCVVSNQTTVEGEDYVVGAPFAGINDLEECGCFVIFCGKDFTVKHVVWGAIPGDKIGLTLIPMGDVDGDKKGDLLVGGGESALLSTTNGALRREVLDGQIIGPRTADGDGSIYLVKNDNTVVSRNYSETLMDSTKNWTELVIFVVNAGDKLLPVADANGDGVLDFIVVSEARRSDVHLISGIDGRQLQEYTIKQTRDNDDSLFGISASVADVINNDNGAELVIGLPHRGRCGELQIFDLNSKDEALVLPGSMCAQESFRCEVGWNSESICLAPGSNLLVATAQAFPWSFVCAIDVSSQRSVWSLGIDQVYTTIECRPKALELGASMVTVRDLDGDGVRDLLLGSSSMSIGEDTPGRGMICFASGRTGTIIRVITEEDVF